MNRRVTLIAAAAVLIATLTACQQPTEGTSMTLDEAKSEYLAAQADLRSSIPADVALEDLGTVETATLLPCDTDPERFIWPGAMTVSIAPDTDTDAVLDGIADEWAAKGGWTPERGATSGGAPTLDLAHENGLSIGIAALEGNTVLQISGFSACFALDEYDPLEKY